MVHSPGPNTYLMTIFQHLLVRSLVAITLGSLAAPYAASQIVINEVSASNRTVLLAGGAYSDWVELYNTGAVAVNLTGWWMSDKPTVPLKWPCRIHLQRPQPVRGSVLAYQLQDHPDAAGNDPAHEPGAGHSGSIHLS